MKKKMLLISILSLAFTLSTLNVQAQEANSTVNTTQNIQNTLQNTNNPVQNLQTTQREMQKPPCGSFKGRKFDPKVHEEKMKEIDKMLDERLKLTDAQKKQIEKNRKNTRKELEKVFNEMKKEQKNIKDVYLTGIPKYQANIRTSASKAKLAVLQQKANSIREENRKNFEKLLTAEQKTEFEKIKSEMRAKMQEKHQKPGHRHNGGGHNFNQRPPKPEAQS